jgi:MFS family permease
MPAIREFLALNPRLLAFGFAFTFFSCFGRTFFISLFGGEIRASLEISPGEFSYIYSGATLAGVVLMPWLGRLIDEVDLRIYATALVLGLIGASVAMGLVTHTVTLFVVLFVFRLTGGSLMNHTAIVTVARKFTRNPAAATGFISLGVPMAEALLPLMAVATMALWGWRLAWFGYAIFLAVVCLPLILWLLRPGFGSRVPPADRGKTPTGSAITSASWPRKRVVRDPNFYRVLPAYILPTPIMTTLFFHQAYIAEVKSWSLEWLATCFVAFAATTVIASLVAGPFVDRLGPSRILPLIGMPMTVGLFLLAFGTGEASALGYMTAVGLTMGARYTLTGAIWVERYGADHLGAIRALVHTVTMSLYGIGPALAGGLIDAGVDVANIVYGLAIMLVLVSGLAMTAARPNS